MISSCYFGLVGCGNQNEHVNEVGVTVVSECKGIPAYLSRTGFVPGKPFGYSVAEKGATGLSLIQFPGKGVPYKLFTLPSWSIAGHLGAVTTDAEGNSYVIPRPFVNTLRNDPLMQNIIYKVDSQTGTMAEYIRLESEKPPHTGNPYGLMGLFFDCEANILYASSVVGSTASEELGTVYAISLGSEPTVKATLMGFDAMGLGICYVDGKKKLFMGKARNSDVYSIDLDADGGFEGEPVPILTLEGLGDRGDDKPRKIRFDSQGNMVIGGVSFNFNLANSADRNENIYSYQYDPASGQWVLGNIKKGIL